MSKSKIQMDHLLKDKKEKRELKISHKKPSESQQKEFRRKYGEFKDNFLAKNTLKSMVFENGSAIALTYKEMQKIYNEVQQIKNQLNYGKDIKN